MSVYDVALVSVQIGLLGLFGVIIGFKVYWLNHNRKMRKLIQEIKQRNVGG